VRVLFDTSVLVAALVEAHPRHDRALPWLKRAQASEIDFLVSSHSLAELYSVLSTLPARPRLSPAQAWRLVLENVASSARLVALSPTDYTATLQRASELGLSGGVIYDALIARAAEIAEADRLLTFNEADFRRVLLERQSILLAP